MLITKKPLSDTQQPAPGATTDIPMEQAVNELTLYNSCTREDITKVLLDGGMICSNLYSYQRMTFAPDLAEVTPGQITAELLRRMCDEGGVKAKALLHTAWQAMRDYTELTRS